MQSGAVTKPKLFTSLGKATKRGVRTCPQCGTLNGTRGIVCKNRHCKFIFKSHSLDCTSATNIGDVGTNASATKIVTGSLLQLYSVNQNQRSGTTNWGFVQLPLVQDTDGNPAEKVDIAIYAMTARCHVSNCNSSLLAGNDLNNLICCDHVEAAVGCTTEATSLLIDKAVFGTIPMPDDVINDLWTMLEAEEVPVVQRITDNTMVVRCNITKQHPLGYLYFFISPKYSPRTKLKILFRCSCSSAKMARERFPVLCTHFYSCICAFASDSQLTQQYLPLINLATECSPPLVPVSVDAIPEIVQTIYEETTEVYASDMMGSMKEQNPVICEEDVYFSEVVDSIVDDTSLGGSMMTLLDPSGARSETVGHLITDEQQRYSEMEEVDESRTELTFLEWLGTVNEMINQTMHYQFDGKPEALVFHIPQTFFDCFQQRLSLGSRKKRLPNTITGIQRKHTQPKRTLMKCTWNITNILQLKQIFDTPMVPLEITRTFHENQDGTYDVYQPLAISAEVLRSCNGKQLILPAQLKTFLKVGYTSPDQDRPVPFVIEWTPNILPNSEVGELRIQFEYGHQRNGQIEHQIKSVNTSDPLGSLVS